ncbi:MAG TPA: peptidoglycan recognition family protein [Chthoniobacterales bacterium]|nr:peptidoglycan recognition family protein [Chthoniobacterales bacterium]
MANSPSERPGHGSSNEHAKPPIKQFIASPNHSSRNGARIDKVVLHCTEASLNSTLAEFQNAVGRQVSAHYVIDRNGDIYQMVEDSERANHCRGANESSIGIEHVGKETDVLTEEQAAASAALIRWLLQQYDIPRARVFGHDFTPGYNLPGGTSCPDKLFGAKHSQPTIAAWVDKNV